MSTNHNEENARGATADPTARIAARITPDEVKERLESLNTQVTTFIKDHAGACMVGALALGYIVARIARGRS